MSENESSYGWWISINIKSKEEEDNRLYKRRNIKSKEEEDKRLYKRRNIKYPGDLDTKLKTKKPTEIVYTFEELKWHN